MLARGSDAIEPETAIASAKAEVKALFGSEGASNIGLEEIDYNEAENVWDITVGFSRPWDAPRRTSYDELLAKSTGQTVQVSRTYKRIAVDGTTGTVLRITHREL